MRTLAMAGWKACPTLCMVLLFAVGCATNKTTVAPATQRADVVRARSIDQAILDGVAFLKSSQNPDGSWGTGTETHGNEVVASVPGSHDGYRVATTALCVMALRECGETEAHARGLNYLIEHGDARRADPALLYNVWAHFYALQCLSIEAQHSNDERIKKAAEWQLDRLKRYQTYLGGWNYYDFHAGTQQPSMGATSFGTAAGLVALYEARKAGLNIEDDFLQRTIRRVSETRLSNGAYLYGVDYKYIPRLPAHDIRGSIGRSQACNFALWLWNSPKVGEAECVLGLHQLQQHHDYINMGRKRPYPHESWYQTAGYYYYFGHYYAGRIVERIQTPEKAKFRAELLQMILPYQEPDGSWWDYAMWDYHKPYGTAFALMTLTRCR